MVKNMSDRKTFVLDTNTLLHDPESLLAFGDNDVVVPLAVLEELAQMKRNRDELAKNARAVFAAFDRLKDKGEGDLHQGVKLENGGCLKVQIEAKANYSSTVALNTTQSNYRILMAALFLHEKGEHVVFVSKDLAMRVKAEVLGLEAQDYKNKTYSYENMYRGFRKLTVDKHLVDLFYKDGSVQLPVNDLLPNEYCFMQSAENSSAVGKFDYKTRRVTNLMKMPANIWGVTALNVEQKCALDLLLRDDVKLVTLIGPAGTGKTLLALATGLRKVFDEGTYNKILVSRPIVPLGKDIGYLPGMKEEKLIHWMQPIYDNLEFLCGAGGNDGSETLRWVNESRKLEMEAVTYIRGRSLPKMYIIIDEAQNLTPHEVKTVISRAGQNTKVVLTGDPTQIDNPYLDKNSNGLTYLVSKFKDYPIYGHVFMEKTERSELAALAAEIM
jgi:PhoH-like ATPase